MPNQSAAQPTAPAEPPSITEAISIFTDKINDWLESGVANLPNLIAAVIVFVLFWIAARLLRKALDRALGKTPLPTPVSNLIVSTIALAVLVTGLFVALGLLGLDKTVASLLAGVGIIGLALGFAFQDIAANFMAGIVLSFRRPFAIGEFVETNGITGTVNEINLRSTILHRPTGEVVLIPNKEVLGNPITNYSAQGRRRIDLGVGVAYGDDLSKARDVAIKAVEGVPSRMPDREVQLFYNEFGDSSINFTVRFWIPYEGQIDFHEARSEAIMRIKKAFDENDITIPFPIRTLDFGVVGGEPLAEHMPGLGRRSS